MHPERADAVILGAGAAGLMTAISLGRSLHAARARPTILLIDGAKTLGAKILVAGGGRCNVTHHVVDEHQYAGSTPGAIRSVLRRLTVEQTIDFFAGLGVHLKQEDTGKLFPTTDRARTVLDALINEAKHLNITLLHPWRVSAVHHANDTFTIVGPDNHTISSPRLVLATGGKALPRSGSDGLGYTFAHALGHTTTKRIFPALVPLVVAPASNWITELSGISCIARAEVRSATNKRLATFTNSILCTHFGLSGPGILDISRHYLEARAHDRDTRFIIAWLPDHTLESLDRELLSLNKRTIASFLRDHLPERLSIALAHHAGIDPTTPGHTLSRDARRSLVRTLLECDIAIADNRGFTHAEVTAGGIPLAEVDVKAMHSRACPKLWLVGEILDVDGRIGGFNFQWAWASGHIAGQSLAADILHTHS